MKPELQAIVDQARDAVSARRVVGEPFERDGVTVLPVAIVVGGGGGGGGGTPGREGTADAPDAPDAAPAAAPGRPPMTGAGGGYGLLAWPVGAYVIAGGRAEWRPVVHVTVLALGGQLVALAAILTAGAVARQWLRLRGRR